MHVCCASSEFDECDKINEVSQDDLEISDFDIIDYLNSTEAIATYLNVIFEGFSTNEAYLRDALGAALRTGIALSDDPTELVILLWPIGGKWQRDTCFTSVQSGFSSKTPFSFQAK